jgi:DNA-binding winged helix-turn-helix (wHTH) protein/tetratricopeptide (TPR) repeat protein
MGSPVYHFEDFYLNPLARELIRDGQPIALAASAFDCLVYLVEHRERPVGRDELISTVWGKTSVSENLLAQTMVRLRRALGDASNEQRCIKTVARVGYRWMLDTVVVTDTFDATEQVATQNKSIPTGTDAASAHVSPLPRRLQYSLWAVALCVLAIAVTYGWWRENHHRALPFNHGAAAVLPAEVDAPEDWKWLHFGLMDLIAGDLRKAKIPVESSQSVLGMLNQGNTNGTSQLASFEWVVHSHVVLVDNVWQVHLAATSPNGSTWQAESSSDNVLKAVHSANYLLLAQIGAASPGHPPSVDEGEEYLMHIQAAEYADSIDTERELIDGAPADLRKMPEFEYMKAKFYCNQGQFEPCKQGLADLLQRLSVDTQPVLRGKVLAHQWYVYFREHKYPEGEAALSEAIQIFKKQNDPGDLAFAYAQKAELENMDGTFDKAETDFGLARVNYALAGDTAAAIGIDESLAALSMQRGRFNQALPIVQGAYAQYERAGMRQFLPGLLQDMIVSQRMLLQYADELAVTDRYWPFEKKHWDIKEDLARHVLTFERAHALADNGRTTEASTLLEKLLAEIKLDPRGEPGLQGNVEAFMAQLALQRGDLQTSRALISRTLAEGMLDWDNDKRDQAYALLTNVIILQRAGKPEDLRHAVADMQAWAASPAEDNDWIAILLLRAKAAKAWNEGQRSQALDLLKLAMDKANTLGAPELIVDIGQVYAQALLITGKVNDASAVSGLLSSWTQLDWRAAWAQACVYHALGQSLSWEQYRQKARELAGDRLLPADASVFLY